MMYEDEHLEALYEDRYAAPEDDDDIDECRLPARGGWDVEPQPDGTYVESK